MEPKTEMANTETVNSAQVAVSSTAVLDDLPGMVQLTQGVRDQRWPHTVDARIWADEWAKTLAEHPTIATDKECMVGWFANAIMAGYDTASLRSMHPLDGLLERRNDCMSALTALYLAVDKRIADDVNDRVKAYIRELEAEKQPIKLRSATNPRP